MRRPRPRQLKEPTHMDLSKLTVDQARAATRYAREYAHAGDSA